MKNLRIVISGKVHKTGFLFFIKQFSQLYSINGYAKYTGETSIFIEAEGTETNLEKFAEYCKTGPSGSIIKEFKITRGDIQKYGTFNIIEKINT